MNSRGGVLIGRPLRNRDSSRIVRTVSMRLTASRSKTGFAIGWSPTWAPSPVRHSTFATPIAAAPSTSPWMAMRLRSRHEICITTE